jgi:argininosuccinate synthase
MTKKTERTVILAYSGGLDTSVMLHWLKHDQGCTVVAYCADVGQAEDFAALREKAFGSGAAEVYIEDLRGTFVRDFAWMALKAGAVYEGTYLLGTALARPVIAAGQIALARQLGAATVAHGATGKGNDQLRFELSYYALAPDIQVIAPWREWDLKGRSELIKYCQKHHIPTTASIEKPYSIDHNLMHCSYEGGILEDPWNEPPADMFRLTKSPADGPEQGLDMIIGFRSGEPVSIDGVELAPIAMLERLNGLAGEHGIGRVDLVENRAVGLKSRGIYESPGMTVLHIAHQTLETITLDREVQRLKASLAQKFAEMIYNGFWYSPENVLLRTLVDETQQFVTGEVRVRLYRGNVIVTGRRSPYALYNQQLASFETDHHYDQRDSAGFIKLQALRLRTLAARLPDANAARTTKSMPAGSLAVSEGGAI